VLCIVQIIHSAGQADFSWKTLSSCNFSAFAPGDSVRAALLVLLQADKICERQYIWDGNPAITKLRVSYGTQKLW